MKPEYARPFILLCCVACLALLLMWRFHPGTRGLVMQFFFPFEKTASKVTNTQPEDALLSRSKVELIDEIGRLKQELRELESANRSLKELREENRALRNALKAPQYPSFTRVTAHVIDRDPAKGGRLIRLDRGTIHGIKPGCAVVAGEFLIGRVKEANKTSCAVVTITDPNCKVPATVMGMKAHGIMCGAGEEGWKSQPYCLLKHLPRDLIYEEGQKVVTSTYSEFMPPLLPIGVLSKRGDAPLALRVDQLYQNAWVKPQAFDYNVSILSVLVRNTVKKMAEERQ